MRILYLVDAQQKSFKNFAEKGKTNFPWVDTLIKEMVKFPDIVIGLGVPLRNDSFQKAQNKDITLYGFPVYVSDSYCGRLRERITKIAEKVYANSYVQKAIDDFSPDVIQVFGTENPFGLILPAKCRPLLIHFQGSLQIVIDKWFAGISKWDQFRYASIKDLILLHGSYYQYFVFKKKAIREEQIIRNCKYFIGRTSFDKRLISMLSPKSKYFHCEEFIREDFFKNHWNVSLTEKVSCVCILKGVTYKGVDLLVKTLALLIRYSSILIEFKICGITGNEEFIEILKRKYRNSVVFSRFKFLGKLDTNTLIEQLCSSNFFIHPSYVENSSNSICEAMALGMPVVCTNVGGTSTLVQDGVEGLLVQEGEPYSLAAAIVELIDNYDYAILLGVNAREKAKSRHNPDILGAKMINIYQSIISDNNLVIGK